MDALNFCKLEIAFKYQTKLFNSFHFKDPLTKGLIFGVVFKFQCSLCNESYYGESIIYLDIRSGEQIGLSPAVCDHLLHYNFLLSFDNFDLLVHKSKKYLLEIKDSLLIMRDKPSLDRSINSALFPCTKNVLLVPI